MKLHWPISAGEFFELLRPAALVISALLSTWVLASSRRRGFGPTAVGVWTLGAFLFPFIVIPIYLIVRTSAKRRAQTTETGSEETAQAGRETSAKFRFLIPTVYGMVVVTLIGVYLYRDHHSIDAHLARAAQAKVMNQRARAISEYRAALSIEDNAHTHKLLGVQLADANEWPNALREFREAERGGEPDDALYFLIGRALEATGQPAEARLNYVKFLNSPACRQVLADNRCATARENSSLTNHLP